MSALLDHVATRAAGWSATADRLKSRLERARWTAFGFSIGGALLAALASQMPDASNARTWLARISALLLAYATFVSARFLGAIATQDWVRARAASEALKREAFRFATQAAPYDDTATAEAVLDKERAAIEDDVDDLLGQLVAPIRPASAPRQPLDPAGYRAQRVRAQAAGFYRPRAAKYQGLATRLKRMEFLLALAASLVTVLAGVGGQRLSLGGGISFDPAALTAVLTTVGAAILAHIEASRYEHLVVTYLASARRLEDQDLRFDADSGRRDAWSAFVNTCEDIIAAENLSWVAKWTGDAKKEKAR